MKRPKRYSIVLSLVLLFGALSVKAVEPSSEAASPGQDICPFPGTEQFSAYCDKVQKLVVKNRRCYFPLKQRVVIRCFVMEDGVVRDPQIQVSSGIYSHDMSCVDALLCSSPLPRPPYRRNPFLIGSKSILSVDALAAGPLSVLFEPADDKDVYRLNEWTNEKVLQVPIVPLEVAKRYPSVFTETELIEPKNYVELEGPHNLQLRALGEFRYPWTELYNSEKGADRATILARMDLIQKGFSPMSPAEGGDNWKDRWAVMRPPTKN